VFGLVLLSASLSTVDLVVLKFQANKHPPLATSPHPIGPAASSANPTQTKNHELHYNNGSRIKMKELSYEIWMPLKFLHQGLWLPSPSIQCRLEWYTGNKVLEKLVSSIIRIVTFFSVQLNLSGQPWKWRQKISPTLNTYTIIRMWCHILRDTHLRIAWWSHVRRHNKTCLYELNTILPGLQPRWLTFVLLISSQRSFKTQAISMLQPLHIKRWNLMKEGIKKSILILWHTPSVTFNSNYSKSKSKCLKVTVWQ